MITFHTFSQHDLDLIFRHRRNYNRLGFAVQLAFFRYPGWALSEYDDIPTSVIGYIAQQLQLPPDSFSDYAQRENTLWEHMGEIREEYGYKNFSPQHQDYLLRHLTKQALENGNTLHLIEIALSTLRQSKVILPAMYVIENMVWEARQQAGKKVYHMLYDSLTQEQKHKIDALLMPTENGISPLAWLKEFPGQSSPETFLKVIEQLERIRDTNLSIDTTEINSKRLRQLAKIGARYEPYAETVVIQKHLKTFSLLIDVQFVDGQDVPTPLIFLKYAQIRSFPYGKHLSSSFPPYFFFPYKKNLKFHILQIILHHAFSHIILNK